ncbi:MAG: alpha-L-fucosidase [Clostridia bacterium]|nr:alpha-L-fucosidase [Clostridia bacterium]
MSITHDNKFGMFIHWGAYATLGLHEQALARYSIPRDEYESMCMQFNPTEYDPEKWVLLAKKCGMKYICFTAKHHDGFCMWDTKQTEYNIMNTSYGKDVLKMLSDACKKHGILLSLYYSNPDWHYEYGYNPESKSHQWGAKYKDKVDTVKLREFIKAQITELLTNYGDIYTLFWDIPPCIYDPSLNELARKLQPNIYINDRGWSEGDFSTPEREYESPNSSHFTRMTEACNSVGQQSWGFRKNEDFYSKRHLCSAIDRYMSAGASYLLNVGPNDRGVITPEYEKNLLKVADWYCRMNSCLESADADDTDYGIRHNKYIATKKNGKTYLHFYEGLISSSVAIKNYPTAPKKVTFLNSGKELNFDLILLPEFIDMNKETQEPLLHIYGIDIDNFADEPTVLEIEW